MLYSLKGRFQNAVQWVAGSWMTPNQATFFGAVFCALISASLICGSSDPSKHALLLLVPPFFILRLVMNALDGLLARKMGIATPTGEYLNEFSDVLGDTVCYGSLYFIPNAPNYSLTCFLLATWFCEYAGIMSKAMPGGIRQHGSFLGGKAERAIWISIAALLFYFNPAFTRSLPAYLSVASVFVILSAILRIRKAIQSVDPARYVSHTSYGK